MQRDPYPRDDPYETDFRMQFTWWRSFVFGWWFAWGFTAAIAVPWAVAGVVILLAIAAATD